MSLEIGSGEESVRTVSGFAETRGDVGGDVVETSRRGDVRGVVGGTGFRGRDTTFLGTPSEFLCPL